MNRRLHRFLPALVLGVGLGATLNACTLTYLPPLREARAPEPRLTLAPETGLRALGDAGLELVLYLETVPEADWLAVQWFNPRNEEVAATSLWVAPGETERRTALPADVSLQRGLWRAVVSYRGQLVRQLSLEVGGG
jgi:hypothetical protein